MDSDFVLLFEERDSNDFSSVSVTSGGVEAVGRTVQESGRLVLRRRSDKR